MNEIHLANLAQIGSKVKVKRNIGFQAGEGFKALFQSIIQPGSSQTGPVTGNQVQAASPQGESAPASQPDLDLDLDRRPEIRDNEPLVEADIELDDADLQRVVESLEGADDLSAEDLETLVEEIKSLLEDPEIAAEVQRILEDAGLDLSQLNEHTLRQALDNLPAQAKAELVALLKSENTHLTIDTVAQALSDALGDMLVKHRKNQREYQTLANDEGQTLDNFLRQAKARVVEVVDEVTSPVVEPVKEAVGQLLEGVKAVADHVAENETPPEPQLLKTTSGQDLANQVVAAATQVASEVATTTQAQAKGVETGVQLAEAPKNDKARQALRLAETSKSNHGTEAEKSQMMKRLMAQARMHLKDGEGRFQIRLDPPELGNVRITIENREGQVSAHIMTETNSARQTLLSTLGALKHALAEQGIQVGEVHVTTSHHHGNGGQERQNWQEELERRQRALSSRMVVAADRRHEEDVLEQFEEDDSTDSVNVTV